MERKGLILSENVYYLEKRVWYWEKRFNIKRKVQYWEKRVSIERTGLILREKV